MLAQGREPLCGEASLWSGGLGLGRKIIGNLCAVQFYDAPCAKRLKQMRKLLLGELLLEESMQCAEERPLSPRLLSLAALKVRDNDGDLIFGCSGKRRLEIRNIGDARGALREDLFAFEMFDERIEAGVF